MDTTLWIVVAVVAALAALALVAWGYGRSRRSTALRDQFGPEYDRTVSSTGSRRKAERELAEREKAHETLDIRPLSEAACDRYTEDWQRAERHFLDDPELAAREADRIVRDVLDDRGYPNDDFDSQAAAVSVDHPNVVARYRHGHEMLNGDGKRKRKGKDDRDLDRTENLRQAMVDFRAVFEQLVEPVREPEAAVRA